MLYKRDRQLAKALLAVCSCYFLFVMPITILDVFPQEPEEDQEAIAEAYLAVYCLYWLQYSANFVIYAARCEQYQKAYKYLFEHVKMCICGASQWKATGAIMVINHQPKDEAIFEPNESSTIIIISRC